MSIRRTIENNEEAGIRPNLYEDRHIWIPIYLDHHFWAGMRSTQRSESMHSFGCKSSVLLGVFLNFLVFHILHIYIHIYTSESCFYVIKYCLFFFYNGLRVLGIRV
ncbi:hypothetical protein AHAS_Ahas19G0066000 [Arachis hypogaea]